MDSRNDCEPLYLVIDTNAFLASPNLYHENQTGDSRTALEMLKAFHGGNRGTLPPVHVRIPWIVRQELLGLSFSFKYDQSRDWTLSVPGRAAMSLFFLNEASRDQQGVISYQSEPEHREALSVQRIREDKDELVLLCCLQVKKYDSENVWLISNDVRLTARAACSGIISLNFCGLKHALTLKNGPTATLGDTFIEKRILEGLSVLGELNSLRKMQKERVDNITDENRPPFSQQYASGRGTEMVCPSRFDGKKNNRLDNGDNAASVSGAHTPRTSPGLQEARKELQKATTHADLDASTPCSLKQDSITVSSPESVSSPSAGDSSGMLPERENVVLEPFKRKPNQILASRRPLRGSPWNSRYHRPTFIGRDYSQHADEIDARMSQSNSPPMPSGDIAPLESRNSDRTFETSDGLESLKMAGFIGGPSDPEMEDDGIMITSVVPAPPAAVTSAGDHTVNSNVNKRKRFAPGNISPGYQRGIPNHGWKIGVLKVRQELSTPFSVEDESWSPFPVSRFH